MAEPIGACPDGARVHVGNRSADGQWFELGWDSSNPPSTCYALVGQERVGRVVAYVNAALITPPTQPPVGTGTVLVGTPAMAATLTTLAAPTAIEPTPASTVAPVRTPTVTPPPFALSAGTPTCAATADGQFLIRWTVVDPRRLLAGLAMTVTGPGGQSVPAVTRTDAEGNSVGTVLVSAAGAYDLAGSISNIDGTVARTSSSVVCAGEPPPQVPTATTAAPSTPTPVSVQLPPTNTVMPTDQPPLFLGTALPPPARAP